MKSHEHARLSAPAHARRPRPYPVFGSVPGVLRLSSLRSTHRAMFENLAASATAVTPRLAPTRRESRGSAPGINRESVRFGSLREDLFGVGHPSIPPAKHRSKVSIVGTGQVGLACAYSMINPVSYTHLTLPTIYSV